MRYTWKVTDDGMNVYEDGVRVAKFETNQFVHILAELSSRAYTCRVVLACALAANREK
jgi:hypothetical protein